MAAPGNLLRDLSVLARKVGELGRPCPIDAPPPPPPPPRAPRYRPHPAGLGGGGAG